ncbi:TonB-dependent receptor domain-containing protein [Sabulibacter ruber]|uniref:TonB-dependent receptor domain-containing protein n=1 Tax=Sabulibacter ruber TaxID=2811901 RepID=UPI001A957D1A|nr:TonB-dependent receptor [Sabulibacter ruber]
MRLSIIFALLSFCLFSFTALEAQAQTGKVTGAVADSATTKPVEFATVTLTNTATGKPVDGTITDDKGQFTFSKVPYGSYAVSVSYLGYVTSTLPAFTLSAAKQEISFPKIGLRSSATKLQEVTVVGQKPLIEDKGDRLVYNAEQDISNIGTTASDVLRKVPSITVDADGNVQLRGSGNFKVLMDGKASGIMANNLADALKQIPADVIKSVEVITSPSAKYDAEGTAGIINIITKKNSMQGVSGKLGATLGNRNRNLNASLNARKGKFGFNSRVSGYDNNNRRISSVTRTVEGQSIFSQEMKHLALNHGFYGQAEVTFDPDTLNAFNLSIAGRQNNFTGRGDQFTRDANGLQYSDLENIWKGAGVDMNFGYTHTFKPQHELSVLAQWNHNESDDVYDNKLFNSENALLQSQVNNNDAPSDEKTFQVDYSRGFKNEGKLELGAKTILRDATSNTSYNFSFPAKADSVVINNFDYDQDVVAAYFTYAFQLKKKYSFHLGTRYEHTATKGVFHNTNKGTLERSTFANDYDNVIPSLSVSRTLDSIHTVRVSYTQRIQRPQIWSLNPFLQLEDFNNGFRGNPTLDAELTHSYEISYNTFFKTTSINASVFMRQTDNAIQHVVKSEPMTIDGTTRDVLMITFDNLAKNRAYGLSLSGSTKPISALSISPSFNLNYVDIKSNGLSNKGFQYNFNLNTSYDINKTLTAQVSGGYYSGGQILQGEWGSSYYTSFSVRKKILDDKGSISFGVNNPFAKTIDYNHRVSTPAYTQEVHNYTYNRTLRLSFDWNFGKMQASNRQKKTIQNDDAASGGK